MLRDITVLVGTVALCLASMFLIVGIGRQFGVQPEHLHGPTFVFNKATIILTMAVLIVPILIIMGAQAFLGGHTSEIIPARGIWAPMCIGLLVGILVQGSNYFLKYAFSETATFKFAIPSEVQFGEWLAYFGWFLFCLILNSISEELVYRVFPLHIIQKQKLNPFVTVLVISLAFSLIHFLTSEASIGNLIYRTMYGILLCQVYLVTKSLWIIVGFHTGTNLLASFLSDSWKMGGFYNMSLNGESALSEHSFSMVLLTGILFVWLFAKRLSLQDH